MSTGLVGISLVGKCTNDGHKEGVFALLLRRELFVWDQAGVLFFVCVLDGTIFPASGEFVAHPVFMAGHRSGIGVVMVKCDAIDGAFLLPEWSLLPWGLGVVAERCAIGTVGLVAHVGDGLKTDWVVCHLMSLVWVLSERAMAPHRNVY